MATSITINLKSTTESTITVGFYVTVTYAATYKIKYGITGGESRVSGTFELSAGGDYTTYNTTFSDLKAGTTYEVWCSLYNASTGAELGIADYLTVTTEGTAVTAWSWTASNGSATAAQTQAAYSAITGDGYTTSFSYLVWNDLVNKANEVLAANSKTWSTTYGSLSATLMTSSDKAMTARRFNAVWYQFNQSALVSSGDTMNGSYFVSLASAINSAIS